MPKYRLVKNGYVSAELSDADIGALFRTLSALRSDAYTDFGLVIKGHVSVETLKATKALVGASFHDFLEVNFENGRGPIASVVRDIVHYLNGRLGYLSVLTSIQIVENKLMTQTKGRQAVYVPSISSGHNEVFLKDGDTVLDYDYYRLLAALGPATMGRFLLLLGGEDYV